LVEAMIVDDVLILNNYLKFINNPVEIKIETNIIHIYIYEKYL